MKSNDSKAIVNSVENSENSQNGFRRMCFKGKCITPSFETMRGSNGDKADDDKKTKLFVFEKYEIKLSVSVYEDVQ